MEFKVLLIGAGEINFGSVEGPWNHSLRLERKLVESLRVVAIVDIDIDRVHSALTQKLSRDACDAYAHCRIYDSIQAAQRDLPLEASPQLAILGTPPSTRGSDTPGHDLELQVVRACPKCALFVEKPVSNADEAACGRVSRELSQRGTLVGVGYMLRYLKAVQKMKEIIQENHLVVMGTNARYLMAYEFARKNTWWDKSLSGGPIIEQATHFCDLSRYFGGEVNLKSVVAHTVEHDENPGRLSAQRIDETTITEQNRLPRLTSATWKFENGAVGSLTHAIILHGTSYETEFEVYADGYYMKLVNPYGTPVLYLRQPGVKLPEVIEYEDDDPFYTEISAFVDAVGNKDDFWRQKVLSSYEDAIRTYEMTWQIRRVCEDSAECHKIVHVPTV